MPAYNAGQTIIKALKSIIAQSFKDFVIVVVDDASTDNTWESIQSVADPRILSIRLTENQGNLAIRNHVFKHSQSAYITFQDADDWSHPERLQKLHTILSEQADLALCGSWCFNVFDTEQQLKRYPISHTEILENIAYGATNNYCSASAMFRREVLESVGYYDELFNDIGSGDIDWQTRVTEQFTTANLPEALYYYRQHSESFSKSRKHPLSHLSADIAYFCHLLRKNGIIYSKDEIIEFIKAQAGITNAPVKDRAWQRMLLVLLYRLSPEKLRNSVVARRRKKQTQKWIRAYNQ